MFDLAHFARGIHGHVAVLGAVACLHPALALRDAGPLRRGTRWAAGLATGLLTAAVAGGWALYPAYRETHKPQLLQQAFGIARLFETKEHLGFYALALAWAGALLAFSAASPLTRRTARRCYGFAGAIALVAGALGMVVGATG